MSPHASTPSSPSPSASWNKAAALVPAEDDVRDIDGGGDATACRWSVDAEARPPLFGTVGLGEVAGLGVVVPFAWISPAAVDSLLVKDDIAQPAHDEEAGSLACGVPIRGAGELSDAFVGGRALSGMASPALRIFCR